MLLNALDRARSRSWWMAVVSMSMSPERYDRSTVQLSPSNASAMGSGCSLCGSDQMNRSTNGVLLVAPDFEVRFRYVACGGVVGLALKPLEVFVTGRDASLVKDMSEYLFVDADLSAAAC